MIITLVESSTKERHLNQSRKVTASIVDLSIPAPHLCSLLLPAVLAVPPLPPPQHIPEVVHFLPQGLVQCQGTLLDP